MEEEDSMQFRKRLLEVANGLGREDVEGLKFLCKDLIPFGKLEAMAACDIFQFLISNDTVNQEDTFLIAELLYRLQRNDLLPRIGYSKEVVQEYLPQKRKVSEYRQMLYELSEDFTEDNLGSAKFLLDKHLPKRQSEKSAIELLTALERKDLLSENDLDLLENLCSKISPDLLKRINAYKLNRVTLSVQESKETTFSSVRKSSSGSVGLPAATEEGSIKNSTRSLDSWSSSGDVTGYVHSLGSNPGVKAENPVGHSEQSFPVREKDEESNVVEKYKMDGPCRGHCLIFNNVNFEGDLGLRKGSQKDAVELKRVFEWLGLEVAMYDDQTTIQIEEHLKNWRFSVNWKECDCLVCCILSHGKSGEIYGSDAHLIPIRTIMSYFTANECPLLAGKPKLFFIQACQGKKIQKAVYLDMDTDDPNSLGADAQSMGSFCSKPSIPAEADFLLGMATVDGYLSFRHIREGTWYIQALCTKLQQMVPRGEDILSILTEVNKEVSCRADPQGEKKQMPQPAYTLRKKLIFPVPRDPPPSQQQ